MALEQARSRDACSFFAICLPSVAALHQMFFSDSCSEPRTIYPLDGTKHCDILSWRFIQCAYTLQVPRTLSRQ
jgi:hypothetical protein